MDAPCYTPPSSIFPRQGLANYNLDERLPENGVVCVHLLIPHSMWPQGQSCSGTVAVSHPQKRWSLWLLSWKSEVLGSTLHSG